MRRAIIKSISCCLVNILCLQMATSAQSSTAGKASNLDRAVGFAIYLEAHASRLENNSEVCIGFGHGLKVDEKEILSELKRRKLKVHSNEWCNQGPRGQVISIIPPVTESAPGTYELTVTVGDLRPIRQSGEHFATLVRRGTYSVKCDNTSEPELVRYKATLLPGTS